MRYKNARVSEIDTKIKEIIEKNLIREESGDVTIQRGIVFYGDVGRGKTYAMYAIRNGLTAVKGNQSEVKTWQEFLFAMKLHYSDPKTNPDITGCISTIMLVLGLFQARQNTVSTEQAKAASK